MWSSEFYLGICFSHEIEYPLLLLQAASNERYSSSTCILQDIYRFLSTVTYCMSCQEWESDRKDKTSPAIKASSSSHLIYIKHLLLANVIIHLRVISPCNSNGVTLLINAYASCGFLCANCANVLGKEKAGIHAM